MDWLSRWQRENRRDGGEVMRVPVVLGLIGGICVSLFSACAVLSQLYPGVDRDGVPLAANARLAALFLVFAALGLPVIVPFAFEWHRLTPQELHYRTLTRRGVLRWSDVRRVRYSRLKGSFRLETTDGRVVRINGMLTGLPLFARTVNDEVAPHKIDPEAQAVLDRLEAGHLPTLSR